MGHKSGSNPQVESGSETTTRLSNSVRKSFAAMLWINLCSFHSCEVTLNQGSTPKAAMTNSVSGALSLSQFPFSTVRSASAHLLWPQLPFATPYLRFATCDFRLLSAPDPTAISPYITIYHHISPYITKNLIGEGRPHPSIHQSINPAQPSARWWCPALQHSILAPILL